MRHGRTLLASRGHGRGRGRGHEQGNKETAVDEKRTTTTAATSAIAAASGGDASGRCRTSTAQRVVPRVRVQVMEDHGGMDGPGSHGGGGGVDSEHDGSGVLKTPNGAEPIGETVSPRATPRVTPFVGRQEHDMSDVSPSAWQDGRRRHRPRVTVVRVDDRLAGQRRNDADIESSADKYAHEKGARDGRGSACSSSSSSPNYWTSIESSPDVVSEQRAVGVRTVAPHARRDSEGAVVTTSGPVRVRVEPVSGSETVFTSTGSGGQRVNYALLRVSRSAKVAKIIDRLHAQRVKQGKGALKGSFSLFARVKGCPVQVGVVPQWTLDIVLARMQKELNKYRRQRGASSEWSHGLGDVEQGLPLMLLYEFEGSQPERLGIHNLPGHDVSMRGRTDMVMGENSVAVSSWEDGGYYQDAQHDVWPHAAVDPFASFDQHHDGVGSHDVMGGRYGDEVETFTSSQQDY